MTSGQQGLGVGRAHLVADTHDLAGGSHLRSENGVLLREPIPRQHGLLDGHEPPIREIGDHPLDPQLLECGPHHHPGGDLGERRADRLGDEGHRARTARVRFQQKHVVVLHRKLDVDQTPDPERRRQVLGGLHDLLAGFLTQGRRRRDTG